MRAVGQPLDHRPTVGSGREQCVIDVLRVDFRDLTMERGQIFSPTAGPSTEWDIVMCDPNSGSTLAGANGAIPIESVRAVVSVKTQLDSAAIYDCARAAAQLRDMLGLGDHLPAVFAIGLDGMSAAAIERSLHDAAMRYGTHSKINSLLVLGRLSAESTDERYVLVEDEDAFARWLVAIDTAVHRAPALVVELRAYLLDEEEPPDEEPPPPPPAPPLPPSPGGPSHAVADRPTERTLSRSRLFGQILAELEAVDREAAAVLKSAAEVPDGPDLEAAVDVDGPLLDAFARTYVLIEDYRSAAECFVRSAREGRPDAAGQWARAAHCLRRIGAKDRAAAAMASAVEIEENHPLLALDAVQRENDPHAQLRMLDTVTPRTSRERALAASLRAEALCQLDRDAEAVEVAQRGLADRWTIELGERLSIASLRAEKRRGTQQERDANHSRVLELLYELSFECITLGLLDVAMQMDSRLVGVLAILRQHDVVRAIAEWWLARLDERKAESRTTLANALVDALEYEAAALIAPTEAPSTPEGRLLRATLAIATGQNTESAVAELDELVADPNLRDFDRIKAAHARISVAAEGHATWNETADELVTSVDPFSRDMHYAHFLAAEDRLGEAEAVLVHHADRPEGIRALIDLAVDARQWARVVSLVDGLGTQAPAVELLRRSDALGNLNRTDEAEAGWREVTKRADLSGYLRERAWFRLTHSLTQRQAWDLLVEASSEWYRTAPQSPVALWVAADALQHIDRPREAWRLITNDGRQPESQPQRHLVAALAARCLPVAEALRQIADLSDASERSDEVLESMIISTAVLRDDDLPEELEQRVRATFEDYADRFPESQFIQSIPAPTSEEEFAAFAERHLEGRRRTASELMQEVRRGNAALAALALLGGSALTTWLESDYLPLAAPIAETQDADENEASGAIAGAAVWDSSSLAMLTLLDSKVAASAMRALPASIAPRAVQHEVSGLREFLAERDPVRSPGTMGVDGGSLVIWERSREEHERMAARVQSVETAVKRLVAVDPDLSRPSEIADALRGGDLHGSAASWMGAVLLAEERGVPLVCDDRYVRQWARSLGLRTFGVAALLAGLERRNLISQPELSESRWALRAAGGRTLFADVDELSAKVMADGFEVSTYTNALISDPHLWTQNAAHEFVRWHGVLVQVWEAAPEQLMSWVGRILGGAADALALPIAVAAKHLVTVAIFEGAPSPDFLRALAVVFRQCALRGDYVEDPFAAAVIAFGRFSADDGYATHRVIWALSQLPLGEQMRLLRVPLPWHRDWVSRATRERAEGGDVSRYL